MKILTDARGRPNWEIFMRNIETGRAAAAHLRPRLRRLPLDLARRPLDAFSSGRGAKPGERTLYQYVMDISSLGLGQIGVNPIFGDFSPV